MRSCMYSRLPVGLPRSSLLPAAACDPFGTTNCDRYDFTNLDQTFCPTPLWLRIFFLDEQLLGKVRSKASRANRWEEARSWRWR